MYKAVEKTKENKQTIVERKNSNQMMTFPFLWIIVFAQTTITENDEKNIH